MAKFKKGDVCKVVKNLLAPKCVGHLVEVLGIASEKEGRVLYKIKIKDSTNLEGYASEGCLQPIKD